MPRKIERLLFVSDAPHFGGAEQYILSMCKAAQRRCIEPTIYWIPPFGHNHDVFGPQRTPSIRVLRAAREETQSAIAMITSFRRLCSAISPDAIVVNASGRRRFWMMVWLAATVNLPVVWVHQMIEARDHRGLAPRWLGGRMEGPKLWRVPQALRHALAAMGATSVVTLNREDAKRTVRWHRTDSNKIHVIPHGVDCDHYRFDPAARSRLLEQIDQNGSEASSLIVGSAGRLVHGKGIDLLLHAVKRLRDNGITATTLIAGGGDAEDELKELAVELGITDHVHFFGFVDDMAGFYSACDVFVLPSMTESFGLAIAEAMACERAVVATPTSGASRQIRHRKNGWQLNRFEPNELAEALAMLGGDADLRRELGIQARIDVRRCFSIDLTLERTLRAFRGVSHERSRLRWPGMKSEPFVRMTTEDLG